MSAPPILLDDFVRVVTPTATIRQARVYVFLVTPDPESVPLTVVALYVARDGTFVLEASAILSEYRRSRSPRSVPHVLVTSTGEEWQAYKEGCGCGSPIRQANWRNAVADTAELVTNYQAEHAVTADTG